MVCGTVLICAPLKLGTIKHSPFWKNEAPTLFDTVHALFPLDKGVNGFVLKGVSV